MGQDRSFHFELVGAFCGAAVKQGDSAGHVPRFQPTKGVVYWQRWYVFFRLLWVHPIRVCPHECACLELAFFFNQQSLR